MWGLALAVGAAVAQVDVPFVNLSPDTGAGEGVYVDVQIGTPPQAVTVLFDSGSSTLGVASDSTSGAFAECTSATYPNNCGVGSYNPSESSTANYVSPTSSTCNTPTDVDGTRRCGFAVEYGSGCCGMEGALLRDTLRIGSLSTTVTVGAISQVQDGFQEPPANGIMGVSSSKANCNKASFSAWQQYSSPSTCAEDAMQELLESNGFTDRFGVCPGVGAPGVLSLGGANSDFYTGAIHKTAVLPDVSGGMYYSVDLTGFGVGGSTVCTGSACVGATAAIVDTGTAITQINSGALQAMRGTSHSCSSDSDCLVDFQFGGSSPMCIQAKGLMTCQSGTCQVDSNMVNEGQGQTIIGYSALQYLYLEFDRSALTVGFAERDGECSVACSAYLSPFGCAAADCSWDGSTCSGGQGRGSTAAGSRVATGTCIAGAGTTVSDDNDNDGYGYEQSAGPAPQTKSSSSVSTGGIIGIAVMAVALIAAAVLLALRRKESRTVAAGNELLLTEQEA
mmetsp:Transcript_5057/g.15395  ORF Transcript_5057/g.15395 Transcript_5057/m.15395 type:complete len:506 (+) Transcript_5057:21-1538(+)